MGECVGWSQRAKVEEWEYDDDSVCKLQLEEPKSGDVRGWVGEWGKTSNPLSRFISCSIVSLYMYLVQSTCTQYSYLYFICYCWDLRLPAIDYSNKIAIEANLRLTQRQGIDID